MSIFFRIFSLIIFTFISVANVSAQYDEKAKTILDNMSANYKENKGFRAKFVYERKDPEQPNSEEFKGEITVKDEKFHLVIGGQEIFNNHESVWTYIPEDEEVTITEVEHDSEELSSPTKMYTIYQEGYKYLFLEERKIDGEVFNVVDLTPEDKEANFYKIRLVISKNKNAIHSWKIYEKSGVRYTYTLKDYQVDSKISDKEFEFDTVKYPNVELVDLR